VPVLSCQQQRSPGAARRPNPDCGHLTEPSRCHPLPSTAAWRRTQTHGRRDHRSGSASGSPNAAGAAAGVLTIWHSSGTTPHPSPLNAHRRALAWLTGVPPDPAGSTGRITTLIHHRAVALPRGIGWGGSRVGGSRWRVSGRRAPPTAAARLVCPLPRADAPRWSAGLWAAWPLREGTRCDPGAALQGCVACHRDGTRGVAKASGPPWSCGGGHRVSSLGQRGHAEIGVSDGLVAVRAEPAEAGPGAGLVALVAPLLAVEAFLAGRAEMDGEVASPACWRDRRGGWFGRLVVAGPVCLVAGLGAEALPSDALEPGCAERAEQPARCSNSRRERPSGSYVSMARSRRSPENP